MQINTPTISAVLCWIDLAQPGVLRAEGRAEALARDDPNHLLFECGRRDNAPRLRAPEPSKARPHAGPILVERRRADVDELAARGVRSRSTTSRRSRPSTTLRRPPESAGRPGSRTPTETRSRCFSPSSRVDPLCVSEAQRVKSASASQGQVSRANPRPLSAHIRRGPPYAAGGAGTRGSRAPK